ncbi:MAG TPA: hypothetical protein VHD83_20050 [Puia sp.]|nr:hypothetical protein [Puia sp.]
MRLTCLLLLGAILLVVSCHPFITTSIRKENSYDSLAHYSYLITTMDKRHKDTSVSTGFFIRKGDTLWLVSAYHVFTNWSLYEGKFASSVRPAFLDVWYKNADSQIKTLSFPLPQHPDSFYKKLGTQVDYDTIRLSSNFKEKGIYSIEKMAPRGEEVNNREKDTVTAYGYSNVSLQDLGGMTTGRLPQPTNYISRVKKMARVYRNDHKKDQVGIAYFFSAPPLHKGASGAPIFRLRTDSTGVKKVEFVGVQSGSNRDSTRSMMVRFTEVHKVL